MRFTLLNFIAAMILSLFFLLGKTFFMHKVFLLINMGA